MWKKVDDEDDEESEVPLSLIALLRVVRQIEKGIYNSNQSSVLFFIKEHHM